MDKKMIVSVVLVAVIIVGVLGVVITQSNNDNGNNGFDGIWVNQAEHVATYNDKPTVSETTPSEDIEKITIKTYDEDCLLELIVGGISYKALLDGDTFSCHRNDSNAEYRYDLYGFLYDDLLTINTVQTQGKNVSVQSDIYVREGSSTPIEYFEFDMKDHYQASSIYAAKDMEKLDVKTDGRVLTVTNGGEKGFLFYNVTTPDKKDGINFISVPMGNNRQISVGMLDTDTILRDLFVKNGDMITLSSNTLKGDAIETYVVTFTPDGKGNINVPDINGKTFSGSQKAYISTRATVKNFSLETVYQDGPVVRFAGNFGKDSSAWCAAIIPSPDGGYILDIMSTYIDDGTLYAGIYFGTLSEDLSFMSIHCFGMSRDWSLQIGVVELIRQR